MLETTKQYVICMASGDAGLSRNICQPENY